MNIAHITGFCDVPGRIHLDFCPLGGTEVAQQTERGGETKFGPEQLQQNHFGCMPFDGLLMDFDDLVGVISRDTLHFIKVLFKSFSTHVKTILTVNKPSNGMHPKSFALEGVSYPGCCLYAPPQFAANTL